MEPQPDGNLRILSNQICGRPDDLLGVTRPLTGEELAFFNTEFFNHDTDVDGVVRANPHNQFLTCLYNAPQEINLYDLFYDGGGVREAPSQEELEQLGVLAEDGSQICPTDKFTRADMDAFLLENTGLTLAQTNQVDLDAFDYLPEYDAYYHTHGDTNYRSVTFTSGQRRGRLYPALLEGFLLRRRDQRVRHPAGSGGRAVLVRVPPAAGRRCALRLCLSG